MISLAEWEALVRAVPRRICGICLPCRAGSPEYCRGNREPDYPAIARAVQETAEREQRHEEEWSRDIHQAMALATGSTIQDLPMMIDKAKRDRVRADAAEARVKELEESVRVFEGNWKTASAAWTARVRVLTEALRLELDHVCPDDAKCRKCRLVYPDTNAITDTTPPGPPQ